jgi:hypothetical protein
MLERFSLNIFLLAIIVLVASCQNSNNHITDRYYITTFEGETSLTFQLDNGVYIDVVKPSVIEIAHDEHFIIVKQHPQSFSHPPNERTTNYFIVPLKSTISKFIDLNVFGPLTEKEFKIERRSLKVSESLTLTKIE